MKRIKVYRYTSCFSIIFMKETFLQRETTLVTSRLLNCMKELSQKGLLFKKRRKKKTDFTLSEANLIVDPEWEGRQNENDRVASLESVTINFHSPNFMLSEAQILIITSKLCCEKTCITC